MSYTLTIPLALTTDKDFVFQLFKNPYEQFKKFIKVSYDIKEHDYPENVENPIYCSYKVLPAEVSYYLFFLASQVAITYGLKKTCSINNKVYPYFYSDSKLAYVISECDLADFNKLLMYPDFDIHVDTSIESININSHVDINKMNISDELFKKLFGDNVLLQSHCQAVLDKIVNNSST